ncbi:ribonuclease G [Lactiplantibacillus daowaiensis]|uniref:Ribonuclease G n=1 Tax=Lactiplantibacillus daowaiensis TaxID=2559918 RepID=A0ABW1S1U9_9LACO|nr:ribonuclease G [Lactiplantibacillus daowaiensis]
MENTATTATIPDEIKGWNWGAFSFTYLWGIGNRTYLPLFALIPVFSIIWAFVCGFKGNRWAWQNGDYQDVASFKQVQATWNRAGVWAFAVNVLVSILVIIYFQLLITNLGHPFY